MDSKLELVITEQDIERARNSKAQEVDFEAWRKSWRGKPRFKGAVGMGAVDPEGEANAEAFNDFGRRTWLNPAESNDIIMIIPAGRKQEGSR